MFTQISDPFHDLRMPLQERVVDKLADMLFASDMILDMLHDERFRESAGFTTVEESVRGVYEQINALMKQLTD
jgi:uncharacterized membrane protein required for colicin V production